MGRDLLPAEELHVGEKPLVAAQQPAFDEGVREAHGAVRFARKAVNAVIGEGAAGVD